MAERKNNTNNTKLRDSSSKIIFENPTLCAQFLKDYVDIPILKTVQPENIYDVSERFVPLFTQEREADTVKRIELNDENGQVFYLISLIEHKTYVDYNISMQILRYMVYIWEDYEKEMLRKKEQGYPVLISKHKDFRYPVIIPIVYYEGTDKWTATRHFQDRILMQEEFLPYIPDFSYELIQLNEYSNERLFQNKDEISFIMLFNKLQRSEDIGNLTKLLPEELETMLQDTPESLLNIIAKVVRAFLLNLNLPIEETDDVIDAIKERNMGILFENMEKMDIQEERRLRIEAQEQARIAIANAKIMEQEAKQEAKQEADKKIQTSLIRLCQELGASKDVTLEKLMKNCDLTEEDATTILNQYW